MNKKLNKWVVFFRRNYRKYLNLIKPYRQNRVARQNFKISAYISIYNDGNFLEAVLGHVKDHVDELIVVDGAYEWMVPYLEQMGVDPLRSGEATYDAIRASGIPCRTINRIWKNELEKRKTGYEECSHRYVMRVDADEVMFFDDRCLEEFVGSGCVVAEMQFPLYLAPGWVIGNGSIFKYPAQCLMFDSARISSTRHLEYLWLVIPADSLETRSKTYPVFEKPIAFAAHLSAWRSGDAAVNRAVFYVSNWMRKHGVPWVSGRPGSAPVAFDQLFKFIPVDKFRDVMTRSHVAFGVTTLSPGDVILPSPLSKEHESEFSNYYDSYLDSLTSLNKQLSDRMQAFVYGEPIYFDITSDSARQAISSSDVVCINFLTPVGKISPSLVTIRKEKPFQIREELSCHSEDGLARFSISPCSRHKDALRQFIELRVGRTNSDVYGSFQVVKLAE